LQEKARVKGAKRWGSSWARVKSRGRHAEEGGVSQKKKHVMRDRMDTGDHTVFRLQYPGKRKNVGKPKKGPIHFNKGEMGFLGEGLLKTVGGRVKGAMVEGGLTKWGGIGKGGHDIVIV